MKHLKIFETGIPGPVYSGGNVEKMPIIGTIYTKEMEWGGFKIPAGKDEVVEIIDAPNDKKIYVCNRWNKPGTPQLVHEDMVEKYEPKK